MLTLTLLAAMVVQLQRGLKLLMVINQLGKLPPDQMQLEFCLAISRDWTGICFSIYNWE